MNKKFRSSVIAAIILCVSILLLPNVKATGEGIQPTAPDSSSSHRESPGVGRLKIANFSLQEEEEDPITADLSVGKLVNSEQATPGMNLTYTITVQNGGSNNADNVQLDDTLPAGLEFVSLSYPSGWTCSTPLVGQGGLVSCTNPSLAINASEVFTLVVKVPSNSEPGTSYTNVATVSSTTLDPNDENNSSPATSTVMVPSTDLGVTKSVDSEHVNPGANLTYTITVQNGGSNNADNAMLSDTLPGSTTFVSFSYPNDWACMTPAVGAGGTITCTNPSFAANSIAVFTLVVNVPANTSAGATFSNTATITSNTHDGNEENNSSTVTTTTSSADLEVIKVDTPDPASSGSYLSYTITVKNNGPDAAANVTLSDTLPGGTTFVSFSYPNDWACMTPAVGAGGTITCSTGSIASEAGSAVFTLLVKVDSSLSVGTTLTNSATATSATIPDPNQSNNTGTAMTTIANLTGWRTTGSGGVTEDESNPARPTYTNFAAAANAGSPAGTYVLRYNITTAKDLTGPGANTHLRVRFRDEGAGSRVTVVIRQSSLSGGAATLGTLFDSDVFTPSSAYQTQEITFPAVTFDFTNNAYWLEVTLTKDSPTNQPAFGAAQIIRY